MSNLLAKAKEQMGSYCVGVEDVQITLIPIAEADMSTHKDSKGNIDKKVFNHASALKLKEELIAAGYTCECDFILSRYRICSFKLEGAKFAINYDTDISERCVQLKKELAELGCHY